MTRKAFFSFHYERDIWRACQVRNCWVTKPDRETAGFWDKASWEEIKRKGDESVKAWIRKQLDGTSVTVVLIGNETSNRKYVIYEIQQSHVRGNGIFGIYIHNQKDCNGNSDTKGNNPFDQLYIERDGRRVYLAEIYPTYDWKWDEGYDNIAIWIEKAAKAAGR